MWPRRLNYHSKQGKIIKQQTFCSRITQHPAACWWYRFTDRIFEALSSAQDVYESDATLG